MIAYLDNNEIELFDTIQDLPILRFQKFNKYRMQSIEIGNSFEDYDNRTAKTIQLLKSSMIKEAVQELENRRLSVFNAMNEFTPTGKAFAVLVKRINDVHYNNYTSEELDRCLLHLDKIGFSQKDSIEKLKQVKKKSKLNFQLITRLFSQGTETKNKPR